jgi:hypothetical protein
MFSRATPRGLRKMARSFPVMWSSPFSCTICLYLHLTPSNTFSCRPTPRGHCRYHRRWRGRKARSRRLTAKHRVEPGCQKCRCQGYVCVFVCVSVYVWCRSVCLCVWTNVCLCACVCAFKYMRARWFAVYESVETVLHLWDKTESAFV